MNKKELEQQFNALHEDCIQIDKQQWKTLHNLLNQECIPASLEQEYFSLERERERLVKEKIKLFKLWKKSKV